MNKPVVFLKSHVDTFTRKDGVVVQAHDTKVQARSAPDVKTQNEGMGFHGAAMNSHRYEKHGPDGDARSEAEHRDQYRAADHAFSNAAHALVGAGHFANHEQARDFLDSTHGRHLGDEVGHKGDVTKPKWLGRSVKDFKKQNGIVDNPGAAPAAASASPAGAAAAPAGLHHRDLREGDEIEGPDGERHEYSHTERGVGRMVVNMASGHRVPTERDGSLPGFKKTGTNYADPAPAGKPAAKRPAKPKGEERVSSDAAFDQLSAAGARHVASTSGGIGYKHSNTGDAVLPHRDERDGTRTVSKKDLDAHLAKIKGAAAPAAAPAQPSAGLADAGYDRPAHVKTKEDEHHYLSSIPPEQRSAAHKARLKKIFSQGGLGKHSPEYKAHLAAAANPAKPAKSKVQKAGANIGAGSWSKGHQVKIHAPGHELHAKAGEITGPDTKSPGRVVVKHGDGTAHSVHFSDLRPADGHSWPQ